MQQTDPNPNEIKSYARIGTRGSALALWQAETVQQLLKGRWPELSSELAIIKPEGDLDKHSSLTAIGGRGVFTSALQERLLDGDVDLAVHSTKDLPSLSPDGVAIAAYPQREDPRDALISRHRVTLQELPRNPVIGTSSRRRAAQILSMRPDAQITELRGNIDTRLRKGHSENFDAVILACAGLERMGWTDAITSRLSIEQSCPAPGQGALAIETRVSPDPMWDVAAALDDTDIRLAVAVERAFLRGVGGGCTTPIGAHARLERHHGIATVRFWGMLASDDCSRLQRIYEEWPLDVALDRAFGTATRVLREIAPRWSPGTSRDPLAGRRILITGSSRQADPLMAAIKERGGEPLRLETFRIVPVADPTPIIAAVESAIQGTAGWLILTSANAVPALDAALDGRTLSSPVGAVGEGTARALRDVGIEPALVSTGPGAKQLVVDLVEHVPPGETLTCLLSEISRPTLVDGLREQGYSVKVVTAYRNLPVEEIPDDVHRIIRQGKIDGVTFASPSAAEGFRRLIGIDLPAMSGAAMVAIGPTTADALARSGLPVHAEASTPSTEGMIDALIRSFGGATPSSPESRNE